MTSTATRTQRAFIRTTALCLRRSLRLRQSYRSRRPRRRGSDEPRRVGQRPALLLVLLLQCLAASAGPRMAVVPQELDMGRVKPDAHAERPLTITNKGDAPLVVERITTSCPCATVAPLSARGLTLAPGTSAELTVRYTPQRDPSGEGASIVIYSNDPKFPVWVADLRLVIDRAVLLSPADGVFWGLAPRGQRLSKELLVAPGDAGAAIDLLGASVSVPGIAIDARTDEQADGGAIHLGFVLGPDVPLGALNAELTLRILVGGREVSIVVPFQGDVLGDLLLSPPAIISPQKARVQGEKISRITVRSSTGGAAPEIVGAVAVGPVRAVIHQAAGGVRHVIDVHAAENAPGGPQSAVVYVMTSSRDEPIVGVPVYFRMGSPVVCEPDRLLLRGDGGARDVRVRRRDGGGVSVRNLRFEPDSLRAEIKVGTQQGVERPAIVSVAPAARLSQDRRSTMLVIETDVPGAEEVAIPVLVAP